MYKNYKLKLNFLTKNEANIDHNKMCVYRILNKFNESKCCKHSKNFFSPKVNNKSLRKKNVIDPK